MLVRHGIAADLYWQEHDFVDAAGITCHEHRRAHRTHGDTEFFVQFTSDRVTVAFARLALAAGELPQTAVLLVQRALTHEQRIVATNDGRDDTDGLAIG